MRNWRTTDSGRAYAEREREPQNARRRRRRQRVRADLEAIGPVHGPEQPVLDRYVYWHIPGHALAGSRGRVTAQRWVLHDARNGAAPTACELCGGELGGWGDVLVGFRNGDPLDFSLANLTAMCRHCGASSARRALSCAERRQVARLYASGDHTRCQLAELFGVTDRTIRRCIAETQAD